MQDVQAAIKANEQVLGRLVVVREALCTASQEIAALTAPELADLRRAISEVQREADRTQRAFEAHRFSAAPNRLDLPQGVSHERV